MYADIFNQSSTTYACPGVALQIEEVLQLAHSALQGRSFVFRLHLGAIHMNVHLDGSEHVIIEGLLEILQGTGPGEREELVIHAARRARSDHFR